jgi:ectoine hydroxylase-related dioxygenase (phytanoyl-CoA dioxygenase family)
MTEPTGTELLLRQILETQQAHLAEYKRVSEEFRETNRRSVAMYQEQARAQRRLSLVGAAVLAAGVAWWIYCTLR